MTCKNTSPGFILEVKPKQNKK